MNASSNIVLIGFMGSGKSSVGKRLAQKIKANFLDVDQEIQEEKDMRIPEIFNLKGEIEFRRMERNFIRKLSYITNTVISTGGGVVLNKNNMDALSKNGLIFFLKCDVDELIKRIQNTKERPLFNLSNLDDFKTLYDSRIPLYEKYADYTIDVYKKTLDYIVDEIIEKIDKN